MNRLTHDQIPGNAYLNKNGQQEGPYSVDQINELLAAGKAQWSDLVWVEGWSEWKQLSTLVPSGPPPLAVPTPAYEKPTIYLNIGGQQNGPFTLTDINSKLERNDITESNQAWVEGWPTWAPVSSLPGVVTRIAPPPFAPPSASVSLESADVNCLNKRVFGGIVDNLLFTVILLPFFLIIEMIDPHWDEHGGMFLAWLLAAPIVAYFISSASQGTPGMTMFGVIAVDLQGNRITFRRALLRHLVSTLSLIFLLGFFMWNFTKKRQTLHDKIAGTIVIKRLPDFTPAKSLWIAAAAMVALSIALTIALTALPGSARVAQSADGPADINSADTPADPGNQVIYKKTFKIVQVLSSGRALAQEQATVEETNNDLSDRVYLAVGIPSDVVDDETWTGWVFPGDIFTYTGTDNASKTVKSFVVSTNQNPKNVKVEKKVHLDADYNPIVTVTTFAYPDTNSDTNPSAPTQ